MNKVQFLYPYTIDKELVWGIKSRIRLIDKFKGFAIEDHEIALGSELYIQRMYAETVAQELTDVVVYEGLGYPYLVSCLASSLYERNKVYNQRKDLLFINKNNEVESLFFNKIYQKI